MGSLIAALPVLFIVAMIAAVAVVAIARKFIYICGPNEVLVFSGGPNRGGNGRPGYRLIKGGRGFRWPLVETVDRVDLTNMIVEVAVRSAYSAGGIPLNVQGVANIKIAGHQPILGNALERFLGQDRKQIARIAKDTLEGSLRGVLSQLTPEEVNGKKDAFALQLVQEADQDLNRLGLVLDTLKIQNVSDDVSYLDSIGRKQSAEVVKRARMAEAEAKAASTIREAENTQRARLAAIVADRQVVTAETQRRVCDAQTKGQAMVAEQIGTVKALIARAEADVDVQHARVAQVERRLEADVVAPAQAEMEAAIARAEGDAATIIEDGRATVKVLEEMIATWQEGGDSARDIFLMQKLQTLMSSLVESIDGIEIDRLTVLPAGGTSARVIGLAEELKGALGVDVPQILERVAGNTPAMLPAGSIEVTR